jgi:hypothetical protein
MYNNSSFNTNNPNPLIPREQNYVIDRKLLSIHSEDRDISKYPYGNQFSVTLPQPLLNVQSLRLVQSTFPIIPAYYTFSNEYQNTKFRFTAEIGLLPSASYCVAIQEGTYTPCQLAQELTNIMNNAIGEGSDAFNVFYDEVGSRFWFGSTYIVDKFSLDFNYKMEYPEIKCNQPVVWYNYARWGLPYYLGYNKEQYIATTDVMEINYIPPTSGGTTITKMIPLIDKVINIGGEKDIYMEVDKYNSYDEIYPFTESNKNAYDNNAYNGKVNSAFAKIPLESISGVNQDSRNFLLINFVQYEPPIERINKLSFTFRFHDGRLVDFRGLEFNFTIEFNMLRNEILRSKNIRIPAMISL